MKHCPHCNSKLKNADKFCPKCGLPISHSESPELKKERSAKKVRLAPILVGVVVALGIAVALLLFLGRKPFSDDPKAIAEASQSVVKLNCYDKSGSLYATGSGFACFEDNVIVTNYHVIQDNVYKIEASTEAGEKFSIKSVLVADEKQDIAILATDSPHGLQLLQPGDCKTIQKGEKVVAIGSPLGLLNSVSTGVFSGYVKESSVDVLQFTASISSGSSGGALFNDSGEVLGITFASYDAGQNLNLAIPIERVEQLWEGTPHTNIMSVKDFYETQTPTVSVDYVLENYRDLIGRDFYMEGWVSIHSYVGGVTAWAAIFNDIEDVPYVTDTVKDRYGGVSIDEEMHEDFLNVIIYADSLKSEYAISKIKTGQYIQAFGHIKEEYLQWGGVSMDISDLIVIN